MSLIFISHSSKDNAQAIALKNWLIDNGWDDLFLDLDPHLGITGGENWKNALIQASNCCDAVILMISDDWLNSDYCQEEYRMAKELNKQLFPLIIAESLTNKIPLEITDNWQCLTMTAGRRFLSQKVHLPDGTYAEISFSEDSLTAFKNGLNKAGLNPESFVWPPLNQFDEPPSPYKGLRPLDFEDAGIFFGRDGAIFDLMSQLRGLRNTPSSRFIVVLGASGSGKSSFIRAGILPRLARDESHFIVMPIIRPRTAVITGNTGLLESLLQLCKDLGLNHQRQDLLEAIYNGKNTLLPILNDIRVAKKRSIFQNGTLKKTPTLVLTVDQAEELFQAEDQSQSKQFLHLLSEIVRDEKSNIMIINTIRSDAYDTLQSLDALTGIRQQLFSLPPMAKGTYHQVIEKPAKLLEKTNKPLKIDPQLTEKLLSDLEEGGGKDALPLLAFTLERLYKNYGDDGFLELKEYLTFDDKSKNETKQSGLGGIKGAVAIAVQEAIQKARKDSRIPSDEESCYKLLRRGFIPWLAGIDPASGMAKRKVAHYDEVPNEAKPIIEYLVEARLLTKDYDIKKQLVTIEPAHESILRQWSNLKTWLAEDAMILTSLDILKDSASAWEANNRDSQWLNHKQERLADAESYLNELRFRDYISSQQKSYLQACRKFEDDLIKKERKMLIDTRHNLALAYNEKAQQSLERKNIDHAKLYALHALKNAKAYESPRESCDLLSTYPIQSTQAIWCKDTNGIFRDIDFSLDGKVFASCTDNDVNLWDINTGKMINVFTGHSAAVLSIAFVPYSNLLVSGSADKTLRLWDITTGKEIYKLSDLSRSVSCVACSPDGKNIAFALTSIHIWNLETNKIHDKGPGTGVGCESIAFSPDSKIAGSIYIDYGFYTIILWRPEDGKIFRELKGHTNNVTNVVFSSDGKTLVSSSEDTTIIIWDINTGKILRTLEGHSHIVNTLALINNGEFVASGSADKTIRLWDTGTGKMLSLFEGHADSIDGIVFSPHSGVLASGSKDGIIRLWSVEEYKSLSRNLVHSDIIGYGQALSQRSAILATSSGKTISLWDTLTGNLLKELTGYDNRCQNLTFSPSDNTLAFSSEQNIYLLNILTGEVSQKLPEHACPIVSLTFSVNGELLASSDTNGDILLFDVVTGQKLMQLTGHSEPAYDIAFSPNGNILASGSWDSTIRLWDIKTGNIINILRGHSHIITGISFSPNGNTLVSSSGHKERTIRIWDISSGKELKKIIGDSDSTPVFSPDGNFLVTCAKDTYLWDIESGKKVVQLASGHHGTGGATIKFSASSSILYLVTTPQELSIAHFPNTIVLQCINLSLTLQQNDKSLINECINDFEDKLGQHLQGLAIQPFDSDYDSQGKFINYPESHPSHWIERANKGDVIAMFQLASLAHKNNQWEIAKSWYGKAYSAGSLDAQERLYALSLIETVE